MVASHHVDLWQQRNQPTYHVSNMSLSSLMPPYETQRTATNPPISRAYYQTTSSVEMSMPHFSTNGLTSSVPYQSGVFAFDPVPVNPYNMQQAYPMGYVADVPQNVSYTRSSLVQQMPTLQEARTAFSTNQRPSKSSTASPLQSNPSHYGSSYGTELERSRSEPTEGTGVIFSTDVDTLMKAIQAKQPDSPQPSQFSKVRQVRFELP